MLGGGGAAIAADRAALKTGGSFVTDSRDAFRATHRTVLVGLAAVIVSGLLLLAADADTFLHSRVFWLKMALFFLLLLNGSQLVRVERAARAGNREATRHLRPLAVLSLALWFLTTLAGTALPNLS